MTLTAPTSGRAAIAGPGPQPSFTFPRPTPLTRAEQTGPARRPALALGGHDDAQTTRSIPPRLRHGNARQRDLFERADDNRPVPDYLRLATYSFRRTAGQAF